MRIIRFKVTDSTLTRAREILDAGETPPFVVLAETQTAGRGRRGHQWQSPSGNLYATFVLPPTAGSVAESAWIPLKAAVCCAQAIVALTGVRLTIKWPNDLLFAGKKVGGLLCESSITGDRANSVLIGIGLNTHTNPQIAAEPTLVAGNLAELLRQAIDHDAFIANFMSAWDSLPLADTALAYAEWAIGVGQPWIEYPGWDPVLGQPSVTPAQTSAPALEMWRELGLGSGGELLLESLAQPQRRLSLTSAEHRCTWIYAGEGPKNWPLLVADCGNSRLKLAGYTPASARQPTRIEVVASNGSREQWVESLLRLSSLVPMRGWPLFVASVHPEASARLRETAEAAGLSVVFLPKRRLRSHGNRYALSALGIDRLAAIEGALAHGDKTWKIVLAAGTATTIDVIRGDGWHAGGWILPGLDLALNSLHSAARLLPKINLTELVDSGLSLGSETHSAIVGGVLQMTIGAVERARLAISQDYRDHGPIRTLVTGGNAGILLPMLSDAEAVPHLILDGLREMILGGSRCD